MASVFLLISRNQPPCWDTTSKKDEALYPNRAEVSMLGVSQLDRVVEVVERSLQGHTVSLLNHRSSLPSLDLPKVRKNRCVAPCRKQHIRRSHKVLRPTMPWNGVWRKCWCVCGPVMMYSFARCVARRSMPGLAAQPRKSFLSVVAAWATVEALVGL